MPHRSPITIFDWFASELSLDGRAAFVRRIAPHLIDLVQPGDRVLDLCCGTGPVALLLDEVGALVTGIDLAPGLLDAARREADKRGANAEFIQADVFTADPGAGQYDLALCLGNALQDFPHDHLPHFTRNVARALRPGGRFVIHYLDGVMRLLSRMKNPDETVHAPPCRIRKRFVNYDPVRAAYDAEYHNLTLDESCVYTGYIHTGPAIRTVFERHFALERPMRLDDHEFLDRYVRR